MEEGRSPPDGCREGEALRYAEAILGTMRQPLVALDTDLRVERANRAFYRTFEVEPDETEGRLIYELGNGQWNIPKLHEVLEHILPNEGEVEDVKVEHAFERIGRRVMLLSARRMERAERPDTILLAIDDVTEREHARALLEAEKEYVGKIIDSSRDALLILDFGLRVKSANETFYNTFRVDPSETEGRLVYELGNGQWDIPKLRELLENVLPDDDAFDNYEVEHDFPDLGHRTMVLNARRVDHMQLILLAIEDQTKARRAERALRESEALLSLVMHHAPVGIGLIDRDGRWVLQNPHLERVTAGAIPSRDPEQGRRWHSAEGAPPEQWPGARALRGEAVSPGMDFRAEIDGERWMRVSAAPISDQGEVRHAVLLVQDITEAKEAEEERELLLGELNHRVKNIFAVIRSLATQGGSGPEVDRHRAVFLARLDALVGAHTLALESRWGSIEFPELVARTLKPYMVEHSEAVEIGGDPVRLDARRALSVALAMHELATNAVKYGALSIAEGRVRVAWRLLEEGDGQRVVFTWEERGGPAVEPPEASGFGTRLIEHVFAYDLHGEAELGFRPEGLRVDASFPVS